MEKESEQQILEKIRALVNDEHVTEISLVIPMYLPRGTKRDVMTEEFLNAFKRDVIEQNVYGRLDSAHNDIECEVKKTIFGAGDFTVRIMIFKPATPYSKNYYSMIMDAIQSLVEVSRRKSFSCGKKVQVQRNFEFATPEPLVYGREAA